MVVLLWLLLNGCIMAYESADMIIHNGILLTMNDQKQIIPNGAIAINGDTIVAVGSSADIMEKYHSNTIIDAHGSVIMPGLINGHTHAGMTFMRGLADDMILNEWLEALWKVEKNIVDEEFVYWSTQVACYEMIKGGITTFADIYYFVDHAAQAAVDFKMRAVIAQTVIDAFPIPGCSSVEKNFNYLECFIEKWQHHPLITPAVGPHATYTCSEETLKECEKYSAKYSVPLLIHASESIWENETVLQKYGKRPIALLDSLGMLNERTVLAHCVKVTDEELNLVADRGASIIHNPCSNMKLGSGTAPITSMLSKKIPVGLGTDSAASNNALDLWSEMKNAALLQKLALEDCSALDAYSVLEMATIKGAQALGKGHEIGSLEAGKKADLILVKQDKVHQTPSYSIPSQLVYASRSSDVDTVIINGTLIMADRKVLVLEDKDMFKEKIQYYTQKIKNN